MTASNDSVRYSILQLLLVAALIAAPVPRADAHPFCGDPVTSAEASPSPIANPGVIPTADGGHLHFDQCYPHAQLEAPLTPEFHAASHMHPPEHLRQAALPGTSRAPYRPPIA